MGHHGCMTMTVRALGDDDADATVRLWQEAFGFPTTPSAEPASLESPGSHHYGVFDGPVLAAVMTEREFDSYYGGVAVPTSGIAGVTVSAEHRSRGLLSPLFHAVLAGAKERGATISTLFPSAPGIYRRFGYDLVADFLTVRVPTQVLAQVAAPAGVLVRRAESADIEAIRAVYDAWAREQNGPLSRRGVSFDSTATQLLDAVDAVTVAVDPDGTVCGFVRWKRGQGFGEEAVLQVIDLLATSADAYRALLRTVGSFATVTHLTTIKTSGPDLARFFIPSIHWSVIDALPYMLKIVDVCGALDRPCAPGLSGHLGFAVVDDFMAENNGGYLLEVADGRTQCRAEPAVDTATSRVFTSRGLALMYAGAQSSANLRMAGHLCGGDPAQDTLWDAVFGGRQLHIRNHF
jgi:predicted acetyltransferase